MTVTPNVIDKKITLIIPNWLELKQMFVSDN